MTPTSSTCLSGTRQLAPRGLPSNLLPTAPLRSSQPRSPTLLAPWTGTPTPTTTTALVPTTHNDSCRLLSVRTV